MEKSVSSGIYDKSMTSKNPFGIYVNGACENIILSKRRKILWDGRLESFHSLEETNKYVIIANGPNFSREAAMSAGVGGGRVGGAHAPWWSLRPSFDLFLWPSWMPPLPRGWVFTLLMDCMSHHILLVLHLACNRTSLDQSLCCERQIRRRDFIA